MIQPCSTIFAFSHSMGTCLLVRIAVKIQLYFYSNANACAVTSTGDIVYVCDRYSLLRRVVTATRNITSIQANSQYGCNSLALHPSAPIAYLVDFDSSRGWGT